MPHMVVLTFADTRGPVEDGALMVLAASCAGVVDIGCSPGFRIDRVSMIFGAAEREFCCNEWK